MEDTFQTNTPSNSFSSSSWSSDESASSEPSASESSASELSKSEDRAQKLQEAKAVNSYLKFLNQSSDQKAAGKTEAKSKAKTRWSSPASLQKQLARLEEKMASADMLQRLDMAQKQLELQQRLVEAMKESEDQGEDHGLSEKERLERDFIASAQSYGARKGISYSAWRQVNVPAAILRRAGIYRGK